ncbi:hypothetical protein [Streptomyces sp. YIM 121038]|uniref:hypothetical protein n=1 Tax=Streptomyces sp. YIM 121038 TaxID=2136401 RepID=UPI0014873701|nr:hypothetical protein [Streptomyces sp. YIM 121038]
MVVMVLVKAVWLFWVAVMWVVAVPVPVPVPVPVVWVSVVLVVVMWVGWCIR